MRLQDLLFLNYVRYPSKILIKITASAFLSRYAAATAHRKLTKQIPTDVNKGAPKPPVFS